MEAARKIFLIAFAVIMINSVIITEAGLSLGSVQVKKSASVEAGDSVQFKLLLFNVHGTEDLFITTDYNSPEGWVVSINPSEFTLPYKEIGDKSYEEGFEFLGTGAGDVKAKPVWINIKVPEDEFTGSYSLRIEAKAKKSASGVAMSQSRSYTFDIDVLGQAAETVEEEQQEEGSEERAQQEREDREPPQRFPVPEVTGAPGIVQTTNATSFREQTEDQINGLTGMLVSSPLIAPIALGIAALAFILLRVFKRI